MNAYDISFDGDGEYGMHDGFFNAIVTIDETEYDFQCCSNNNAEELLCKLCSENKIYSPNGKYYPSNDNSYYPTNDNNEIIELLNSECTGVEQNDDPESEEEIWHFGDGSSIKRVADEYKAKSIIDFNDCGYDDGICGDCNKKLADKIGWDGVLAVLMQAYAEYVAE